jgi:hypothetical protein
MHLQRPRARRFEGIYCFSGEFLGIIIISREIPMIAKVLDINPNGTINVKQEEGDRALLRNVQLNNFNVKVGDIVILNDAGTSVIRLY